MKFGIPSKGVLTVVRGSEAELYIKKKHQVLANIVKTEDGSQAGGTYKIVYCNEEPAEDVCIQCNHEIDCKFSQSPRRRV